MKFDFKPRWWGGRRHTIFTIVVFVILASLDNAARGVFPPLYAVVARDLSVSEASLGLVTAATILIVVFTSVLWGYWGDRSNRKRLLLYGTLIWSTAMFLTGLSQSYSQLFWFQFIAAVGIGCIASVGFSVISDFIPPARRGLALSFWGLSQGGGAGAGAMLAGIIGARNWPLPFFLVAAAGFLFVILYLFTFEPARGRAEPELAEVFAAGGKYNYQIQWSDLRYIMTRPSNIWLILQSFIAMLTFGSMVWMSRLFIAKVEAVGYSLETATISGNLLSLFFQTGFYFAIVAGHWGDRWQQRDPRGRARLSMIGIWATIPFQIAVFLIPMPGLILPDQGSEIAVVIAALLNIVTNLWVAGIFVVALVAVALASIDPPNRTALLTDTNLPEHRGTVRGLFAVAVGLGAAIGNALAGASFAVLEPYFAPPLNFAVGLSLFQLFLIPAGLCYYQLTKTTPRDIIAVKQILTDRAKVGL